jgi:hypothetical protein
MKKTRAPRGDLDYLMCPVASASSRKASIPIVVFTDLLDQQGKGVKAFTLSRVQVLYVQGM